MTLGSLAQNYTWTTDVQNKTVKCVHVVGAAQALDCVSDLKVVSQGKKNEVGSSKVSQK
jgi:hypothetical protein